MSQAQLSRTLDILAKHASGTEDTLGREEKQAAPTGKPSTRFSSRVQKQNQKQKKVGTKGITLGTKCGEYTTSGWVTYSFLQLNTTKEVERVVPGVTAIADGYKFVVVCCGEINPSKTNPRRSLLVKHFDIPICPNG